MDIGRVVDKKIVYGIWDSVGVSVSMRYTILGLVDESIDATVFNYTTESLLNRVSASMWNIRGV